MESKTSLQDSAIKKWRFFAILWPLLCFAFAGIILCCPGLETENRIAGTAFAIVPLIPFSVGMGMFHRLLKERSHATASTTATVISVESKIASSGGRIYFPIYEFHIGEKSYQVKYPTGYSTGNISKGQQVDLYYNPKDPLLFYVPAVRKRDKRWATLLCGLGIVYPLIGLASQLLPLL